MDKSEAFEFLELNIDSSQEELKKRWQEKFNHFQNLQINAPTPQLKAIHSRNLEKLDQIKSLLLVRSAAPGDTKDIPPYTTPPIRPENNRFDRPRVIDHPSAMAFLVRHTEGKDAKTYPLKEGVNPVGRLEVRGHNSVVIDDDPYVSRYHAVLYVSRKPGGGHTYQLADDGALNNGQASKNGTYINGSERRITARATIYEADTIQIGVTKLMLMANSQPVEKIVKEVKKTQMVKTVVIDDLF